MATIWPKRSCFWHCLCHCSTGGSKSIISRSQNLRKVDRLLAEGNDIEALQMVSSMQIHGVLRGFGTATQVPQRAYSIDELRLNKIDTSKLLSPEDYTLGAIRRNLQLSAVAGVVAAWNILRLNQIQSLAAALAFMILGAIDKVAYAGGLEALIIDTMGRLLSKKYTERVAQHEAGHFLIAYLLGILPKGYTLSSLEAFVKERSFNIQAGTIFVDFQFLEEVNSGKLSSLTLNRYCCIALAGVATEYLLFGFAEGGVTDIRQLDNLLKGLGFTPKKAESLVRWAVLNTVILLRRHKEARTKLAEAMSLGKSIGECIDIMEIELENVSEI